LGDPDAFENGDGKMNPKDPKSTLTISMEEKPSIEDTTFVRYGLRDYNNLFATDDGYQPLTLFLRREDGSIAGGLLGEVYWGWLHISILWISEEFRGQGYGKRIMEMAENEALKRGCRAMHLDTMSFQAQPFYEKLGFAVFGKLDDLPEGFSRIYMWKKLAAA
jgi:GNAT superfamily N-acetyltransferase